MSFRLPTVLAKCQHNALNALYRRHLTLPPNPFRIPFHPSFLRHIAAKVAPNHSWATVDLQGTWKDKKTVAKITSIEESVKYDAIELQKAKSFVKREVNPDIPTKARLIQGNKNDRTAYLHPDEYRSIAHAFQNLVFVEDGVEFDLHYTSHLNADQISDLYTLETQRPGHKYYDERDGKNWDSTMQREHMEFESQVYELFNKEIADNHRLRSRSTTGTIRVADVVIKYVTCWKRLSGDWNTSVGNTIISMAICVTVILGLPAHLRPRRVCGFFLGDDYLGVYNYASQIDRFLLNRAMHDGEASMGITPVRNVFDDPLMCEYISMTAWPTHDGRIQFVPKISNMMAKLFYSVHGLCSHTAQDVQATVDALSPTFQGLQIMEKFLAHHKRAWRTKRPPKLFGYLKSQHFLGTVSSEARRVNWAFGMAWKYRLPLSIFDFDLPTNHAAFLLRHPAIDLLYDLEHRDPDLR